MSIKRSSRSSKKLPVLLTTSLKIIFCNMQTLRKKWRTFIKINQINSGIDKKSKQVLKVVSDILSRKLAKVLVNKIIEDIVKELNRK